MIDYLLFRIRIGLNNLKILSGRSKKLNLYKCSCNTALWLFFAVGLVCITFGITLCLSLQATLCPEFNMRNTENGYIIEKVKDDGFKLLF